MPFLHSYMDPYSYVLPMFTVLLGFLFTEPYQRSYFLSGFYTQV